MTRIPYSLIPDSDLPPALGLIVLQADETLEQDFRHIFDGSNAAIYVSRIPSAPEVTPETLSAMKADIAASAELLPKSLTYKVVGYGCTSASAIIGSEAVATLVRMSCNTTEVTNPLRAAIAYAHHYKLKRLAVLSPYVASVNTPLRNAFGDAGIATDTFASFGEAEEAKVARISEASIVAGATAIADGADIDAVFLSCTNLKTLNALPRISKTIGKPVFSSNSALGWHMKKLSGL
jgi:maleate isomerase